MDIREEFLSFFESKSHKRVESAPFIPNDASLLFVNAGMVPFKDVFTGAVPAPTPPRATSCQTCLRAGGKHNDLENVGFTNRHHTFFEMLGNFSFGDYFKKEVISYAWEFLTINLALPKDKLWVTVHDSDDEAYVLWQEHIDISRIKRFGDKDNFWQMGDTGACGPCSEIFYDQGAENFSSDEDYLGGDGDRFLEIWNLVFMQYERDKNGVLHPLPKPSIDTGMGLERVVAIKEGKLSNYDTSLFMPIINKLEQLVQKKYIYAEGASFRVIADHIRTAVFMLSQGINFDKEGRGYVLRRIIRRAIRHGYLLGLKEPFMYKLVDVVVDLMSLGYEYLEPKKENVKELIKLEEQRFFKTIESGSELFNKEIIQMMILENPNQEISFVNNTHIKFAHYKQDFIIKNILDGVISTHQPKGYQKLIDLKNSIKTLYDGEIAFKLYDTFGFPLDLTQDMLKDKGLKVDIEKFEECMSIQKNRSKASWKGSGDELSDGDFSLLLKEFGVNKFVGYEKTVHKTNILAILNENYEKDDKAKEGWVMLEETPFYATSGGQIGDTGVLHFENNEVKIYETKQFFGLNLSKFSGKFDGTTEVEAIVDESRDEITKHHTATHILHSALSEVLGDHITQAGSLVEEYRLKFDFSHPKALSEDELSRIESIVNSVALNALSCNSIEMPIEEAKKSGAKALFGDKYADLVRVVSVADFSVEFCGGTHVKNSSEIGMFIITKESGISAGVRRIEAVVGKSAYEFMKTQRENFDAIKQELKSTNPIASIVKLKDSIKAKDKEIKALQNSSKKELSVQKINGVNVIIDVLENGDIKNRIDEYKNKYNDVAVMLFQPNNKKVIIAAGSNSKIKAGAWVKEIASFLGGGGGGRDDFAQAGGRDISKVEEAKVKALEFIKANS